MLSIITENLSECYSFYRTSKPFDENIKKKYNKIISFFKEAFYGFLSFESFFIYSVITVQYT